MRAAYRPVEGVGRRDRIPVDLDYIVTREGNGIDSHWNATLPAHLPVEDGYECVRGVDHVTEARRIRVDATVQLPVLELVTIGATVDKEIVAAPWLPVEDHGRRDSGSVNKHHAIARWIGTHSNRYSGWHGGTCSDRGRSYNCR